MRLLDHVSQLMRKQLSSLIASGLILPRAKHHIAPHGVSLSAQRMCRLGGRRVGVHANMAKISAESRFKKSSSLRVQRPTRSETLDQTGGHGIGLSLTSVISRFALCDGCFVFTGAARCRTAVTAGAGSLQRGFRHAHDFFGDFVGLLLVHICGLTNRELWP